MNKERKRGFTLVEMLVVIGVISILIGILFLLVGPIMENKERKQAEIELQALKLSLVEFHRLQGEYPHCPKEICSPEETLFLSLIGFHNERGNLQLPPYRSLVHESLFTLPEEFDSAKVPNRARASKKDFIRYLVKIIKQDITFLDPWGEPYAYEFPRDDGLPGFLLYSKGPDGETGEGLEQDDVGTKD